MDQTPSLPALDRGRLVSLLVAPGGPYADLDVVAVTGSTNADLVARVGAAHRTVLATEEQQTGRGRLGRAWSAPPRTSLLCSVLLRPERVPPPSWSWLPLLVGVALTEALRAATGVALELKWPNDLLAPDGRKVAGILVERIDDALGPRAVVGFGVNVAIPMSELPTANAASLLDLIDPDGPPDVVARTSDRTGLLASCLENLAQWEQRWNDAAGDSAACGLASAYRCCSATIGAQVVVHLAGGQSLQGLALDVDPSGALVLQTTGTDGSAAGQVVLGSGEVFHLRPVLGQDAAR